MHIFLPGSLDPQVWQPLFQPMPFTLTLSAYVAYISPFAGSNSLANTPGRETSEGATPANVPLQVSAARSEYWRVEIFA